MEFLKKLTNFFKKFCELFRREKTFENKEINASNSKSKTVYVNKNNYTNEAVKNTKKFAVSIISEKTKKEV